MPTLIRTLVVLAFALALAALPLELDAPYQVQVALDQAPPAWMAGVPLMILGALLGAVAAIGLLRFRTWGRLLATLATAPLLLGAYLAAQSPIAASISTLAAVLLAGAGLAWVCGVALSYHPRLAPRFRA